MKMWRAARLGVTLEEVELIRGHGSKNDVMWMINDTQTVNQKFIDNDHVWCDTKEQADLESLKLREAEKDGRNVQIEG